MLRCEAGASVAAGGAFPYGSVSIFWMRNAALSRNGESLLLQVSEGARISVMRQNRCVDFLIPVVDLRAKMF